MKSKEVLSILKISRQTLKKYVDEGKIKAMLLSNGYYDYDRDSVFAYASSNNARKNVIYVRSYDYDNQQERLNRQLGKVQSWCNEQNINIDEIYKDISSTLDFNRKGFISLFNEVIDNKIDTVYCYSKGSFSNAFFNSIKFLFSQFKTNIICINPQDIDTELYKEGKDLIQYLEGKISEKNLKKIQEIAEKTKISC